MAVITGSFNSLVSGTISGVFQNTAGGVLSGVIGTPGPAGTPGAPGTPGTPGAPGQGVAPGGSAGQALVKVDGTDYNTTWSSLPAFLTKAGNLDGLTDLATARSNLNLGAINTPVFGGVDVLGSGANAAHLTPTGLSLNQTGHGQFTIQPSQGIVWPDTSIQTTAWNDAPSNGTIYGRQDGVWVDAGGSGDYLPLAGGTMDANASITIADTSTGTDSEVAGWGLGVQQSADHTKGTTVEFDGLDVYDGASHMQVTPTGLTFPDATTQTTAATTPDLTPYRELTDYDFTNVADTKLTTFGMTLYPQSTEDPTNYNSYVNPTTVVQSYDDTVGESLEGTQFYAHYSNAGLLFKRQDWINGPEGPPAEASYVYGVKLGATGLTFINWNETTRGSTVQYLSTGITFGNASVQTIAFPGFNNTALTGSPTAPTATFGDDDTSIATTAFVQAGLLGGTAVARNLEVQVRNQSGASIPAGSIVYISGATGNLPLITLSQANNDANSAQTMGFVKASIANNGTGYVIVRGEVKNLNTSALTEGVQLYLSPTVAGAYTTTKPYAPQHLVYVGVVIRSHPTLGTILVAVQNGYELDELHDVAAQTPSNNDLLAFETSTSLWKNKTAATLGLAAVDSQAFSGTPSLPTGTTAVTQSVNDNSTKLVTTAFVRDMLSDCTWSAPPISTTTTSTSGTGSSYVNLPPDTGYLIGPNVNVAGFCQKGMQMFARSNSCYGFNNTKEMRIACKMAINWSGTFTGITYTLLVRNFNAGSGTLTQAGFGISINMATKVLSILAHNGTTLTTKATSWAVPFAGIGSVDFMVKHDGTGTVYAYADGVFIDSTTGMSTATSAANTSMFAAVEINSTGGTSTANAIGYVCNLRSFVAHG